MSLGGTVYSGNNLYAGIHPNAAHTDITTLEAEMDVVEADIDTNSSAIALKANIASPSFTGRMSMDAVAIGIATGTTGLCNVAIGCYAGETRTGDYNTALGQNAGSIQSQGCVAVGSDAGGNQTSGTVAIGNNAGYSSQAANSIAIGNNTGDTQGEQSVAVGERAGGGNGGAPQGDYCTAIGGHAGFDNQGDYALAAGYYAGSVNQAANSIVLNATTLAVQNTTGSSCVIKPLRELSGVGNRPMHYNVVSGELSYDPTAVVASVLPTTLAHVGHVETTTIAATELTTTGVLQNLGNTGSLAIGTYLIHARFHYDVSTSFRVCGINDNNSDIVTAKAAGVAYHYDPSTGPSLYIHATRSVRVTTPTTYYFNCQATFGVACDVVVVHNITRLA